MAAKDPAIRSQAARIAAHAMHAIHGPEVTRAARQARIDKWEDEVDPERKLTEADRAKRVAHKQAEHMARMSLASRKALAAKREARRAAGARDGEVLASAAESGRSDGPPCGGPRPGGWDAATDALPSNEEESAVAAADSSAA